MPELYVGLMSGTSLDGIDAVLADLSASPRLVAAQHGPFPDELRSDLLALNTRGADELHRAATAANSLSSLYAAAVNRLLSQAAIRSTDVAAIGCHGQTVRHDPSAGYTLQLVNGALLAELAGISVVCDFRSRDVAAGGQGAPLVPAFHRALFQSDGVDRAIVNIGGMANVTRLGRDGSVLGFDCGPGNVLLDAWIANALGKRFDEGGEWASRGRVLPALLTRLSADPYFASPPPKSTGREKFNMEWLHAELDGSESAPDVQATLLELTATSIAEATGGAAEVFVCGGGARNHTLMHRLRALLPGTRVGLTDDLGVPAEHVEAFAFAWLAQRALTNEPGNVPEVTGAKGLRVLGAIYPK